MANSLLELLNSREVLSDQITDDMRFYIADPSGGNRGDRYITGAEIKKITGSNPGSGGGGGTLIEEVELFDYARQFDLDLHGTFNKDGWEAQPYTDTGANPFDAKWKQKITLLPYTEFAHKWTSGHIYNAFAFGSLLLTLENGRDGGGSAVHDYDASIKRCWYVGPDADNLTCYTEVLKFHLRDEDGYRIALNSFNYHTVWPFDLDITGGVKLELEFEINSATGTYLEQAPETTLEWSDEVHRMIITQQKKSVFLGGFQGPEGPPGPAGKDGTGGGIEKVASFPVSPEAGDAVYLNSGGDDEGFYYWTGSVWDRILSEDFIESELELAGRDIASQSSTTYSHDFPASFNFQKINDFGTINLNSDEISSSGDVYLTGTINYQHHSYSGTVIVSEECMVYQGATLVKKIPLHAGDNSFSFKPVKHGTPISFQLWIIKNGGSASGSVQLKESTIHSKSELRLQIEDITRSTIDFEPINRKIDTLRFQLQIAIPAKASQTEAEAGADNFKFMTPLRTKEAIDALAEGGVDLTKASQSEAESGTNNDNFMTPLRTKEAIDALAEGGVEKVTDFPSSPEAGDVVYLEEDKETQIPGPVTFSGAENTALSVAISPAEDVSHSASNDDLTEDDTYYYIQDGDGYLRAYKKSDGARTSSADVLLSGDDSGMYGGITIYGDTAYGADPLQEAIYHRPLSGGSITTVDISSQIASLNFDFLYGCAATEDYLIILGTDSTNSDEYTLGILDRTDFSVVKSFSTGTTDAFNGVSAYGDDVWLRHSSSLDVKCFSIPDGSAKTSQDFSVPDTGDTSDDDLGFSISPDGTTATTLYDDSSDSNDSKFRGNTLWGFGPDQTIENSKGFYWWNGSSWTQLIPDVKDQVFLEKRDLEKATLDDKVLNLPTLQDDPPTIVESYAFDSGNTIETHFVNNNNFVFDANNPRGIWLTTDTMYALTDASIIAFNRQTMERDRDKDITLKIGPSARYGLWSDGDYLYTFRQALGALASMAVEVYNISTRSVDDSKEVSLSGSNFSGRSLWADDTHFWTCSGRNVRVYSRQDGTIDSSKSIYLPSDWNQTYGLWSDGTTLWVSEQTSSIGLYAHDLTTNARDTSKEFDISETQGLRHLTGEGDKLYVICPEDTGGHSVAYSVAYDLTTQKIDKSSHLFFFPSELSRNFDTVIATFHDDDMYIAYKQAIVCFDRVSKKIVHNKSFSIPFGYNTPDSITTDGTTMWVGTRSSVLGIYPLDFATGEYKSGEAISNSTNQPFDMWSSSSKIYSSFGSNGVGVYDISTRSLENTYTNAQQSSYLGITSDGTTLWIAGQPTGTIFAYNLSNPSIADNSNNVTVQGTQEFRSLNWGKIRPSQSEEGFLAVARTDTTIYPIQSDGTRLTGDDQIKILDYSLTDSLRGIFVSDDKVYSLESFAGNPFRISIYNKETGVREGGFSTGLSTSWLYGLWSDGITIYTQATGGTPRQVYAFNIESETRDTDKEFSLISGIDARDITSDGTTLWLPDRGSNKVYAYDLATKSRDTSKEFNLSQNRPESIASDGNTIWVAFAFTIEAYDISTLTADTSKDIARSFGHEAPEYMSYNNKVIYFFDNVEDNKVYGFSTEKEVPPTTPTELTLLDKSKATEWLSIKQPPDKASISDAEAGTDDERYMTALKTKSSVEEFGLSKHGVAESILSTDEARSVGDLTTQNYNKNFEQTFDYQKVASFGTLTLNTAERSASGDVHVIGDAHLNNDSVSGFSVAGRRLVIRKGNNGPILHTQAVDLGPNHFDYTVASSDRSSTLYFDFEISKNSGNVTGSLQMRDLSVHTGKSELREAVEEVAHASAPAFPALPEVASIDEVSTANDDTKFVSPKSSRGIDLEKLEYYPYDEHAGFSGLAFQAHGEFSTLTSNTTIPSGVLVGSAGNQTNELFFYSKDVTAPLAGDNDVYPVFGDKRFLRLKDADNNALPFMVLWRAEGDTNNSANFLYTYIVFPQGASSPSTIQVRLGATNYTLSKFTFTTTLNGEQPVVYRRLGALPDGLNDVSGGQLFYLNVGSTYTLEIESTTKTNRQVKLNSGQFKELLGLNTDTTQATQGSALYEIRSKPYDIWIRNSQGIYSGSAWTTDAGSAITPGNDQKIAWSSIVANSDVSLVSSDKHLQVKKQGIYTYRLPIFGKALNKTYKNPTPPQTGTNNGVSSGTAHAGDFYATLFKHDGTTATEVSRFFFPALSAGDYEFSHEFVGSVELSANDYLYAQLHAETHSTDATPLSAQIRIEAGELDIHKFADTQTAEAYIDRSPRSILTGAYPFVTNELVEIPIDEDLQPTIEHLAFVQAVLKVNWSGANSIIPLTPIPVSELIPQSDTGTFQSITNENNPRWTFGVTGGAEPICFRARYFASAGDAVIRVVFYEDNGKLTKLGVFGQSLGATGIQSIELADLKVW